MQSFCHVSSARAPIVSDLPVKLCVTIAVVAEFGDVTAVAHRSPPANRVGRRKIKDSGGRRLSFGRYYAKSAVRRRVRQADARRHGRAVRRSGGHGSPVDRTEARSRAGVSGRPGAAGRAESGGGLGTCRSIWSTVRSPSPPGATRRVKRLPGIAMRGDRPRASRRNSAPFIEITDSVPDLAGRFTCRVARVGCEIGWWTGRSEALAFEEREREVRQSGHHQVPVHVCCGRHARK